MPLIKSKSKAAFKKNVETLTGEVGKSPHVQSQKQALAIAFDIKRRSRAEGGPVNTYGGAFGAFSPGEEAEFTPSPVGPLVGHVAKRVLWDVPHEAVEAAKNTPYGLRREDFTDIPPDTSPDPSSPLGSVGINVPRGAGSHLDPLISPSLETGLNVMGGTAFSAPARGAGEVLGAGPSIRAAADKRTVGSPALNEVDQILNAERNLKGAAREPGSAAAAPAEPPAAGAASEVGPGGGGAAGTRGLDEAQAAAARWAGERKPLEGIPGPLKIGEDYFVPGPIGKIHDVAEDYMRSTGRQYTPPDRFHPIDVEHSKAIAQAYEDMKHTPKDPATIASYNALIDETKAQYEAIKKTGLKIEPIPAGAADPYAANPRLAAIDVAENNHLWFFPTEQGFGTVNKISDNPMLRKTGEKIGDMELTANDMFRVVHDYFGHLKEGHGFRAAGEDNAWRTHSAMYSDLARPAMTSETRGQNSWVNYGPHGEKNRTASGADTVYADQKVGLMPHWTMYDKGQAPDVMYHGSGADYLQPNLEKMGSGQGQMAYGAGYYGSSKEKIAKGYRDQVAPNTIMKDGKIVKPFDLYGDITEKLHAAGVKPGVTDAIATEISDSMAAGTPLSKMMKPIDASKEEWQRALEAAKAYKPSPSPGHMYQWALEAPPERFLDWAKTLNKQTPYIQERLMQRMMTDVETQKVALDRAIDRIRGGYNPYGKRPGGDMLRERELQRLEVLRATLDHRNLTGKEVYKRMGLKDEAGNYTPSEELGYKLSAQRLKGMGIPGVTYKDYSSSAAARDRGAKNFVVFDTSILRLLKKYGILGPAALGAAAAGDEEKRASGGRVALQIARRAGGGGAFGVFSPAEQAELDDVRPMQIEPEPDTSPIRFRTASPLVNITERDINRGIDIGMNAATVGPARRIAEEIGAAAPAIRRAKYAEPQYTESGRLITNRGVESAPDPTVQTVAAPYRMMYPGIYRNPRIIAQEAAERVGPEDPAMKQLFGVTRGDLREMAQGRVGNQPPAVPPPGPRSRGSLSAQNIQTPQNTQRLLDILEEGGRHEGLRTADAWYIMDPVYRRMVELHGPEAAERYRRLNTLTGMASPGSDVQTEIARGTGAHWLERQGRFGDFQKYAGIPEELRARVAMPADMRRIPGHPYHRTSQSDPMAKYLEKGFIDTDAAKVPLYVHASGVPETGFQTAGPVPDAHFSRGVGLADTRKGPTDVGASASRPEYQTLQPWWQHEVAGQAGLESVPAQARLWTVLGPQTGVESALGAPKLELLSKQIMEAAQRLRISPEKARDLILSGEAGAFERGGAVESAMSIARSLKRASGGKVHVGPIIGDTGGRADKVPMKVPNGSYVCTADHVSGLGEGNTMAGMKKLGAMFPKSKPSLMRKLPHDDLVPIYAADGEFVVSPEDIMDRYGDLDEGHRILDHWQTTSRKKLIKELATLAPPAQD